MGITSINLNSDGVSYTAAGGDVDVAGSSTYTNANGSTGVVADASFWTGRSANDDRALNTSSSNIALAAAIAAAGLMSDAAAAQHVVGDNDHGQKGELGNVYAAETVQQASVDDAGDSPSASLLAAGPPAQDSAPASSSSSDDQSNGSHSIDNSPAPAADDASDHASSANDDGAAQAAADASPVAPTVAMVSAEALEAAASSVDANAQHGGSVEQIVADALGQGDAPTVDAALANLPGGNGELSALASVASPAGTLVSGWDMGGQGAIGTIHDMMLSMHAPGMHHDAVQPAVNG